MVWWLAQNALVAAGLAGLVALVCRLLRPSPAVRHALWVVVLLKLLTPPGLFWPWSPPTAWHDWLPAREAVSVAPPSAPVPVVVRPTSAPVTAPAPPVVVDEPPAPAPFTVPPIPSGTPTVIAPVLAAAPDETAPVGMSPAEWLATVAGWAWLASALAMAVWQARRVKRLRRLASWGRPAPDWLTRQTAVLAARVGVRPPRVRVVPGRGSPFLWCLGRPVLLVPAGLLDTLPAACWPGLLLHELAHLKRRDHWVSWLLLPAACLWWWNPLFWLVRRRVSLFAELACDAWVIEALPDQRRPFAEALIEVTQWISRPTPAPALGMGAADRRAFERRLTMILHDRARSRAPRAALVAVGLLTAAVLPGFSPGQPTGGKSGDGAMPRALPLEDSLVKARVNGKYAMLLRQFKSEADAGKHGAFADVGPRSTASYAGQSDLPKGHWVYVYPYWYVWRDLSATPKPKRNWGPEQATGEPDTDMAGDIVTAWASRTPDGQDEWLMMEYAEPVVPRAVMIHETYNPGAVVRVTVFKLDGEEVEAWKGVDPTPQDEAMGVSVIPIKVDFKTNRVKIYIDSKNVPGWNEIDAVGLRDAAGKVQWATSCDASTTYAEQEVPQVVDTPLPSPFMPAAMDQRIRRLEQEVRELKQMNDELLKTVKQLQNQMDKKKP